MGDDPVIAVGDRRAGWAARAVIGAEHEMVNEELRATAEKIGERGGAVVGVEAIVLVDPDPGKFLALFRQLVAAVGVFFFGGEQFFPGGEPVGTRDDFV